MKKMILCVLAGTIVCLSCGTSEARSRARQRMCRSQRPVSTCVQPLSSDSCVLSCVDQGMSEIAAPSVAAPPAAGEALLSPSAGDKAAPPAGEAPKP